LGRFGIGLVQVMSEKTAISWTDHTFNPWSWSGRRSAMLVCARSNTEGSYADTTAGYALRQDVRHRVDAFKASCGARAAEEQEQVGGQ
jgi:hypothetical protein